MMSTHPQIASEGKRMALYSKRISVQNAARGLLSKGKRVQLIVGPLESQSSMRFNVHKEADLQSQMEEAFALMHRHCFPGIKVQEADTFE